MDVDEDDILYGITAPARNIPELAIATSSLMSSMEDQEQVDGNELSYVIKHLDLYVKESPLQQVCFKDGDFEWFNVSRPLTFEDLRSHVVVFDFFTYCCINCLHILPDLMALEQKYNPNNSPVLVVGIHSAKFENERLSKCVGDAIKKNDILHPVVNDVKCKLWNDLGICCWPTLLISGPEGLPLFVLMGEGKRDFLFKFVAETVSYFEKLRELECSTLPLEPHVHLPSQESDLYYPGKIELFDEGLIISDSGNNRIVLTSYDGEVMEVIGSGRKGLEDGCYKTASFNNPQGVSFHPSGMIFIADTDNHAIRKIDLKRRVVKTVAGNGLQGMDKIGGLLWEQQSISSPWDICLGHSIGISLDEPPNLLLIAMAGLHQIWGLFLTDGHWLKKRFYREGSVVLLAGSGLEENRNTAYPLKAGFAQPSGIAIFKISQGEIAVIADSESSSVRQFSCIDGAVRKVAGGGIDPTDLFTFGDKDGPSNVARFQHPLGITTFEDKIYVADSYNHKVKLLTKQTKTYITETILGIGILGDELESTNPSLPMLNEPGGLCVSKDGKSLFIADTNNFCIKKYNVEKKETSRIKLRFCNTSLTKPPEDEVDSKDCVSNSSPTKPSEDEVDSKDYVIMHLPPKTVQVNLKLKLDLPAHIHLTPEAHQKYSLTCKGPIYTHEDEGTLSTETKVGLTIDLSTEEKAEINASSKLFLCSDEGVCIMRDVSTLVRFLRGGNETSNDFELDLYIKPVL